MQSRVSFFFLLKKAFSSLLDRSVYPATHLRGNGTDQLRINVRLAKDQVWRVLSRMCSVWSK